MSSKTDARAPEKDAKADTTDDKPAAPDKQGWWLKRFLKKHHRKLWWFHSAYALFLGTVVMMVAAKGFDYARWLALMLVALWALIMIFFRVHGEGRAQKEKVHQQGTKTAKIRFYVMTYFLKNLYQTMLFFLLPFYWKTTSFDHPNIAFIITLSTCAFLSTMDIVFDNFLMRFRAASSVYYGITLFAAFNLAIPALFPNTPTLTTMLFAAGATVVMFWTMHVPFKAMVKPAMIVAFLACLGAGVGGVYAARKGIPPVPMHLADGAVGPKRVCDLEKTDCAGDDGRLALKVTELHKSLVESMYAVSNVRVPGGVGDVLIHVWRHQGAEVQRLDGEEETQSEMTDKTTVRLSSTLSRDQIPEDPTGDWSVDVETGDGQLVGRTRFTVIE